MAKFKLLDCPNCGASINVPEGATSIECAYCGTDLSVELSAGQVFLGFMEGLADAFEKVNEIAEAREQARLKREREERQRRLLRKFMSWGFGLLAVWWGCSALWSATTSGWNSMWAGPGSKSGSPTPLLAEARTPNPTATLLPVAATHAAFASLAGSPPKKTGYMYYAETSHSVVEFAEPYNSAGGVAGLGFPLTEMFAEQSQADNRWYWVQYFEKAVLEYHLKLWPPDNYQLSPLGAWRLKERYPDGPPSGGTAALPGVASHLFAETGHTVTDPFLTYWHQSGGVRRLGYPLSETFEETSQADGKAYIVQYFERAVMEYHPELAAPNDVQMTALGSFRLQAHYPGGAPGGASNPVPQGGR